MNTQPRIFEAKPAVRESVPLLVGIFGCSGSGKTFSALRLATGIQQVTGGDIYVIDTESKRALHYADEFAFKHVDFRAPFGSLDYLTAMQQCAKQGAGVIVVDSMTHEHSGVGGYLLTQEAELDRIAGDDWKKRDRAKFTAWIKPSKLRQQMIDGVLQLGSVNVVMCFRAKEKTRPVKNAEGKVEIVEMGFMPIAGEELLFEMTVNCLLLPKANGVPTWRTDQIGERLMLKCPKQFEPIFAPQKPLDEEIGHALAQWAKGGEAVPGKVAQQPREFPEADTTELLAQYDTELASAARDGMPALEAAWLRIPKDLRKALKGALDRRHKPDAVKADEAKQSEENAEFA